MARLEMYRDLSLRVRCLEREEIICSPGNRSDNAAASNALTCCRIESLWQLFYRHGAAALMQASVRIHRRGAFASTCF